MAKGFLVTRTTKGGGVAGCHPPHIFEMNPRMMFILVPMVSLECHLNIDTKINTAMLSVWLIRRYNGMRPHNNHEIYQLLKSFRLKIEHFKVSG